MTEDRKRYQVGANKSSYYSEEFDSIEEAIQAASEKIRDGYSLVTVRDKIDENEPW